MENNHAMFWIQFSNGYTNASFQVMRAFLDSLNAENFDFTMDTAVHIISNLITDVAISITKVEASLALNRLVGFTEGLAVATQPYQPEARIYQYLYDALSLAEIVPYEDRLDN